MTEDGAGVWAWRNAELARFDDRRIRHLGSGDGSIERCWPADVSGRAAACVVARPGGSLALTRWDDQGGRGPFITLAGARWWPLWGAGLLVGRMARAGREVSGTGDDEARQGSLASTTNRAPGAPAPAIDLTSAAGTEPATGAGPVPTGPTTATPQAAEPGTTAGWVGTR